MADRLDCDHRQITVKTEDVFRLLPKIIWHLDEPHADSAMVGTYIVSELASRYVKVVLNGTGGDELFIGYRHYFRWRLANRLLHSTPLALRERFFNILKTIGLTHPMIIRHNFIGTSVSYYAQTQYTSGFFTDGKHDLPGEIFPNIRSANQPDEVNKRSYTDVKFYLTDDLLFILDKLSMATSIEGRVPLLDHELVEWVFKIDGGLKTHNNTAKFVLKELLKGILPDEVLSRRKMGFGAPVDVWMREGLFGECFRLVNSRPQSRGNLYWGLRDDLLMRKLTALDPYQCFKLLCLELWFRIYADNDEYRNSAISQIR